MNLHHGQPKSNAPPHDADCCGLTREDSCPACQDLWDARDRPRLYSPGGSATETYQRLIAEYPEVGPPHAGVLSEPVPPPVSRELVEQVLVAAISPEFRAAYEAVFADLLAPLVGRIVGEAVRAATSGHRPLPQGRAG